MKIKVTSTEEFSRLINALADEIVSAKIYFNLYSDLISDIPSYEHELNQSNTFWSLSIQALLDASLFRLCRIYDQHSKSLNLQNFLDTIHANIQMFDVENFRQRLKDNPFVDSLSESAKKPDVESLEKDIKFVSLANVKVKSLVYWRNNIYSHKAAVHIINQTNISDSYPLSKNDISILLDGAASILNRYSGMFNATLFSTQIVGHDDYRSILEAVKSRIQQHKLENASHVRKSRHE
jgi:hypothetical protein